MQYSTPRDKVRYHHRTTVKLPAPLFRCFALACLSPCNRNKRDTATPIHSPDLRHLVQAQIGMDGYRFPAQSRIVCGAYRYNPPTSARRLSAAWRLSRIFVRMRASQPHYPQTTPAGMAVTSHTNLWRATSLKQISDLRIRMRQTNVLVTC